MEVAEKQQSKGKQSTKSGSGGKGISSSGGKGVNSSGDGGGMVANCHAPSSQQHNWRWQQWWWHGNYTAMQHHCGSLQHKKEVATNKIINQAATLLCKNHHGSTKWKWLKNKKEKVNNQLEVLEKVAAAVVVRQQLLCDIIMAVQNGSG